MHISTIVKVRANNADKAVKKVRLLIENDGNWPVGSFDWYDEDAIKISRNGAKKFAEAQKSEKRESKYNLERAAENEKKKDVLSMYGYYLSKAGECLQPDMFWSTKRLAYEMEWEDGKRAFYIETDRHF